MSNKFLFCKLFILDFEDNGRGDKDDRKNFCCFSKFSKLVKICCCSNFCCLFISKGFKFPLSKPFSVEIIPSIHYLLKRHPYR